MAGSPSPPSGPVGDTDVAVPPVLTDVRRVADVTDLTTVEPDSTLAEDAGMVFRFDLESETWRLRYRTQGLVSGIYIGTITTSDGQEYRAAFALR